MYGFSKMNCLIILTSNVIAKSAASQSKKWFPSWQVRIAMMASRNFLSSKDLTICSGWIFRVVDAMVKASMMCGTTPHEDVLFLNS